MTKNKKTIFEIIRRIQNLEKENEVLRIQNEKLLIQNEKLLIQNEKLLIQNEKLLEENERLKDRLSLDSSNSSKPPSSDGLGKSAVQSEQDQEEEEKSPKKRSLREKSLRPSGGQKGHKGYTLERKSPDEVIVHCAQNCAKCGKSLEHIPASKVKTRQVQDIPPMPDLTITDHQVMIKKCLCGTINKGEFPENITAPVQYGENIQKLAVYFSGQQVIPEKRLSEVFFDVFGLRISTATLAKMNQEFTKKIAGQKEKTLKRLEEEEVKHVDETGIRVGGKTLWAHVLCSATGTDFEIRASRGFLRENIKNHLVHDHWRAYFKLENVIHVACNAHYLRDLKFLREEKNEEWATHMFELLMTALKTSKMPESEHKDLIKLILLHTYDKITAQGLAFHENKPHFSHRKRQKRKGHNLVLRFIKFKENILRFLLTPNINIPFTNNRAEQDIRIFKIKTKISGAFRSLQGAQTFANIRGFLSTSKKQGQNLLQAIQSAIG
jgi:transposase